MQDAVFSEACYLIKNGIPFDVAFSLSPAKRIAFAIKFGQLDGNKFNFDTMRWEET